MDRARIIVVEDERYLAQVFARALIRDGHDARIAASGAELRQLYRTGGADLVLLDLNLGPEDGMDLARELVATTPVAIVVVTGREELHDRIAALDTGADDYLIKPVALGELRARVRAVLRRYGTLAAPPDDALRVGPIRLEPRDRRLCCERTAASVALTETQTHILGELMRHHGRVVSRDSLLRPSVRGGENRSVDVHIAQIRQKLRDAGIDELVIWAVRGHGYRLRIDERADAPPAAR